MASKYLKTQNLHTIFIFVILNIAFFIVVSSGTADFWNTFQQRLLDLKAKDSILIFATPLILLVLCGILPPSLKAVLVFWRLKNPLPGCRAFSKLAPKDPRIDLKVLEQKLGALPVAPREQNYVWHRLYKQVKNEVTVLEAHKQFLLSRDLTGIAFLFFMFGTLALLFICSSPKNILVYAVITLFEYIMLSIVARNLGNRFVSNVLSEYVSKS